MRRCENTKLGGQDADIGVGAHCEAHRHFPRCHSLVCLLLYSLTIESTC